MKNEIWTPGENDCQNYYDLKVGKDYLCVFANKAQPTLWMGYYNKNGSSITLLDKAFKRKEMQRAEREGNGIRAVRFAGSRSPMAMMRKVEYAYRRGVQEV